MAADTIIETARLKLRVWDEADTAPFAAHTNTPNVMRWLGGVKTDAEMAELVAKLQRWQAERGFTFWAVERRDDAELLAVMEEGLRHRGLGAVIGEAKRADMTATRRLQLAAEGGRTIALLMKRHAREDSDPIGMPSAAITRWRIGCAPSAPLPVEGIGRPRWRVALVRQKGGEGFEQLLEACDATGRLALPAALGNRAPAPGRAARVAA